MLAPTKNVLILMVLMWIEGCSSREKVTFDPPADLISSGLSVQSESLEGRRDTNEIQAAKPFVVTGTFFSKSRLRHKLIIRASEVSEPERPVTMQSGIAEVTAAVDSHHTYKAHLKGIRKAGNYEVQVLYGTKVVDTVEIVVREEPHAN